LALKALVGFTVLAGPGNSVPPFDPRLCDGLEDLLDPFRCGRVCHLEFGIVPIEAAPSKTSAWSKSEIKDE
jgi:hypothetical protein